MSLRQMITGNTEMKKITGTGKYVLKVVAATSGVILVFIFLMLGVFRFLSSGKADSARKKPELDFDLIQVDKPAMQPAYLSKNNNSRPGTPLDVVRGIVVHYTANPGTDAMANRNYFESRKEQPEEQENKVSSHFIIGLDGKILCCVPENEIAYASNDRNADTLSIECCHPDGTGRFNRETYQSLVHLVAYLCDKYRLEKENVIRHYDVTGKKCPKYMVEHPEEWNAFRDAVVAYLKKSVRQKQTGSAGRRIIVGSAEKAMGQ